MESFDKTFIAHYRNTDHAIQSVKEHLENTADYASQFAYEIGMENSGRILGLVHDIGKWTDLFNQYIRSGTGLIKPSSPEYLNPIQWKGQIDHSTAGAQYLYQHQGIKNKLAKEVLGLCVKSHHGGLRDCMTPDGVNLLIEKLVQEENKTRLEEALDRIDSGLLKKLDHLCSYDVNTEWDIMQNLIKNAQEPELKSFSKLEDGIEKKIMKEAIIKRTDFMIGLLTRHLFSCLIDADRIDTSDFEYPTQKKFRNFTPVNWKLLIDRFESHLETYETKNKIDVIRTEISRRCLLASNQPQNIFDMTVPTGGGKTLASMRFALHHAQHNSLNRIIVVVPFTTIIDQNAQTIRDILEKNTTLGSILLEHHSNLTPEEENDQTKCLSESWDAPVIYTTMVQLLETLFSGGTRSVRRMHRLAKSVIIFDEIQNLDVKCVKMFNLAMQYLNKICHSTIVLCTATQPLLDAIEPLPMALNLINEQRIIPDPDALHKELIRTEIVDKTKVGGYSQEEVVHLIEMIHSSGKSVLVIVNTKKVAKDLFVACNELTENLYHLSTNMCPDHRMSILNALISKLNDAREKKTSPVICISTQLIEAGVNVDFDAVIRFVAGLDSIIQSAGRCNRNGIMTEKGHVYIVNPNFEDLSMLKDLQKAKLEGERVLSEYKINPEQYQFDLQSPTALTQYYKYYFYQRRDEMEYKIKIEDYNLNQTILNLLSNNEFAVTAAKMKNINGPIPRLKQSFQTAGSKFKAIDAYTQGVIVPYKDGIEIINDLCMAAPQTVYALIKKAQRYSVNVYAHQFQKLIESEVIFETQRGSGIYYLSQEYYDDDFGMTSEPKIQKELVF